MTLAATVHYNGKPHTVELIDRATGWCRLRPVSGGWDVWVEVRELEE